MRRTVLTLFLFAALSAWVSAQSPSSLTAEIQVKQFKNNRLLIETLVDHGIDLSNADNPLQRADACRQTARTLANYLERAADEKDAERVAEFAGLFNQVVRDGLIPNLNESKRTIAPESPDAKRLRLVNQQARDDLQTIRAKISTDGMVGDHDKVKSALRALEELIEKLK
jgi:hypothetical protein